MIELRIEISEDLKKKMLELSTDWDSIIDTFIREKISELSRLRSIVSKSKLTEKDALELGRKVNKGLVKRKFFIKVTVT
ncbi:MAG: hypothetical protein AABW83_00840 [Nanoarchaeota archaeon]